MATIGTGGIDSNPYARLGLAPGASIADVKRAYRRLAMHFHPDHAGPGSLPTFMAVKTAYEWIVAHQPHAEFDHRRSGRASGPTVARSYRDAPPEATQPAPAPVNRSTWHGGRWYWEGMRARAARQPSPT